MPFKKVGKDKYVSPSGHVYKGSQVRLYYANGGKVPRTEEEKIIQMSKT